MGSLDDFDERYAPRREMSAYFNDLRNRIDGIHNDVKDIKNQTKETNGRVKDLELWRARLLGIMACASVIGGVLAKVLLG